MNRYAVLLALTTLISPAVGAAEMRGEELLWECSGETLSEQEAAIRGIHCIGYLKGMNDAHQIISGLNPSARMYCPPKEGISGDQIIRVVVAWLKAHPNELHKTARISYFLAMKDAFPCERK